MSRIPRMAALTTALFVLSGVAPRPDAALHLHAKLADSTSGQPVTDLQPYLGAFGHTLIMSEDLRDAVHSHPSPGPGSDVSAGRGGPDVTFEGYLPRSGVYRAWTQFLRHDKLSTFTYTFRVLSLDEAFRQ